MEAVKDPDSRRDQTIERLILQYQTPLLRLCYVQLQDQALAEDAVQETFLKAYKGFASFRGDSSEKADQNCGQYLPGFSAWGLVQTHRSPGDT